MIGFFIYIVEICKYLKIGPETPFFIFAKETPTPAEKSLALVPTSVPSPSSAKGKRRGPASVKRKAEKQSSTTLGNKKKEQKLLEEEVADADADKSSQDASSLSLTYEDNDNARISG